MRLDRDALHVGLLARERVTPIPAGTLGLQPSGVAAQGCDSCDEVDCFRHVAHRAAPDERTCFVLDGVTPEFRDFVRATRKANDVLAIPIDGERWRLKRYAWPVAGFAVTYAAPLPTLWRSLQSRRLAAQGAARQRALLAHAERLAVTLARQLPADVTELCVAQPLLPFLWRNGDLGGRRVTVLMSRLPIDVLQARLDAAAAQHPDSPTLADFRAPPALAQAEREALDYAERIVTPHAEIAALFAGKAQCLPWHIPSAAAAPPSHRVAFAGPTLGRKGAYEMRQAAHELQLDLVVPPRDLETPDFWSGVAVRRGASLEAGIVVQPAYVEDSPRPLLAALATGRSVIATAACGLPPQPGLTLIPCGDGDRLGAALRTMLAS